MFIEFIVGNMLRLEMFLHQPSTQKGAKVVGFMLVSFSVTCTMLSAVGKHKNCVNIRVLYMTVVAEEASFLD